MATPVEHSAFIAFALDLRAKGALRVRDGGLEVVFSGDVSSSDDEAPKARVVYSKSEENELAELRAYRERQEELG